MKQCESYGRELTGHEREQAKVPHSIDWHYCTNEQLPKGPVVSMCNRAGNRQCNLDCSGYMGIGMKTRTKPPALDPQMFAGLQAALSETKSNDIAYAGGLGDGVLYVGGGKYWAGIVVGIKLLRESGYYGPIEVWYRGELEPIDETDVSGLGVTLINLLDIVEHAGEDTEYLRNVNGKFGGWAAKSYALKYTYLDRVLYLDADAYCVQSPRRLFDLLDKKPFVFWGDLPHQIRSITWPIVYPNGAKIKPLPVQGGQLLIDRNKTKRLLNVFHYICQNGKHYWQGVPRPAMYGDQDAWRVGMAMNACEYEMIEFARWSTVAFVCSYEGMPYIIHRCKGKMFAPEDIPTGKNTYSNPHYHLPKEARAFELFAEFLNRRDIDAKTVFNAVYRSKIWGKGSGAGSTPKESQLYIDRMNSLFLTNRNIRSIVDLGSGDGLVGMKLGVNQYIGIDVSEDQIKICQRRFAKPNRSYFCHDFYRYPDVIPAADALICKDVFHHWPNEMVVKFFEYLESNNRWKYWVFCCDDQTSEQRDTYLGGYRAIRLDNEQLERFKLKRSASVHHKGLYVREFK